jgi:hypothetical protein
MRAITRSRAVSSSSRLLALLGVLMIAPAWSRDDVRVIDLRIVERVVEGDEVAAAGPARVARVEQGDLVELRWSSDEQATVHLHGYDIEIEVPAGGEAPMRFLARATGRCPIETHGIGADHHLEITLLYLEVHPR